MVQYIIISCWVIFGLYWFISSSCKLCGYPSPYARILLLIPPNATITEKSPSSRKNLDSLSI
jgi:hypothetical protein